MKTLFLIRKHPIFSYDTSVIIMANFTAEPNITVFVYNNYMLSIMSKFFL